MRAYCDLHIHSCLSPCGDALMTPNNIARMAMLKGLDVISVADHNSAGNLPAIKAACDRVGVELLAAMELNSQEEAHLLAYFPEVQGAVDFSREMDAYLPPIANRPELFGEQTVMNEEDEIVGCEKRLLISALTLPLEELIQLIHDRGGAAAPAHINRGNNGLLNVLGFLPPGLGADALEIWRGLPCPIQTGGSRVLHSSDAHYLEDILEREVFLEVPQISAGAVFDWIRGRIA